MSRLGRMKFYAEDQELWFDLSDAHISLWYRCSAEFAKNEVNRLLKHIRRGREFEWTYERETRRITRGPHHYHTPSICPVQ